MDWVPLLSAKRLGASQSTEQLDARSSFQRDQDRLIFSPAFRRMHDKTQVFPLPENDHVHSRLTHSLETSSVGRSLGRLTGSRVLKGNPALASEGISAEQFGEVVAAACLAHDMGNPPFGHSGEDAIGSFFSGWFHGAENKQCQNTVPSKDEFVSFEGNAQGFRLLSRTQSSYRVGGLQLTCATLAAFSKYPRLVTSKTGDYHGVSAKKYGIFHAERELFAEVARTTGLQERSENWWARHPLAFLVEAADDICYRILDVEDGYRLGLVPVRELVGLLTPIAEKGRSFAASPPPEMHEDYPAFLRANAIDALANAVADVFEEREAELLTGKFDSALVDSTPFKADLREIRSTTAKRCYSDERVLQIEMAGYKVVASLLDQFLDAALATKRTNRQDRLYRLLPQTTQRQIECDGAAHPNYEKLLAVTDYVSGMTDSFAVKLFRRLSGISLPGSPP